MRVFRIVLIAVIIFLVLYLLLQMPLPLPGLVRPQPTLTLPMDLTQVIPSSWQVLPNQYTQCDFDGDGEQEQLVVYRFDTTYPAPPARATATPVSRGAIGGVIFDTRPNIVPQATGNQSPYRPAFLVPYKLLPDIYPGKGQGYLGETSVQLNFLPPISRGNTCSVNEIEVFGYSDSPLPTQLSLFRWVDVNTGYRSRHFVGDAQIVAAPDPTLAQLITQVTTYNRLNDRSRLCALRGFKRQGPDTNLNFTEDPGMYTIDFCFGAPPDPAYPEGVVIAVLRGNNPYGAVTNLAPSTPITATTPTGDSFLASQARNNLPLPLASLADAQRQPYRIVALTNPGTLDYYPAAGTVITDTGNVRWLWGSERITITTDIMLNDVRRTVAWQLASVANESVAADTHWRVENVTLR